MEKTQKKFEKAQLENINFLNFIFLCFFKKNKNKNKMDKMVFCSSNEPKNVVKIMLLGIYMTQVCIRNSFHTEIVWQLFKISNKQYSHTILLTTSTTKD